MAEKAVWDRPPLLSIHTIPFMIPELFQQPVVLAAIGLVIAVAYNYQRGLTFREYREIQRFRPRVFAILDVIAPFGYRSFIHEKQHPQSDDEYLTTTDLSMRAVWQRLTGAGGSPHLISSTKRRPDGSLSKWHYVWRHEDGTQTEVYLFGDGAVYMHHETVATDIEGHLSDGITPGDPRGVLDDVVLSQSRLEPEPEPEPEPE